MTTQKTQTASTTTALCVGLGETFRAISQTAYCAYIQQLRHNASLGWEHRQKVRQFGKNNLDDYMRAAEWLGQHKAMAEAARMANELQQQIDSLMMKYCPHEMTQPQKDRWTQLHQTSLTH
jgi:hypothetical protein